MSVWKNSVSLITGGASVVGRAVVAKFVKLGSRVVICDLPDTDGQDFADSFRDHCMFVPVNVQNDTDVKNAIETTSEKFGKLNYVINCAERVLSSRPINWEYGTTHPMEAFNDALMTNVSGTFNVIRHAVPLMSRNESVEDTRGVIINKSSTVSMDGQSGQSAFAACKGAVNSMTLPLARELGPNGIRVVTIAAGLLSEPCVTLLPTRTLKYMKSESLCPRRLGDPEEFAHLCQTIIENPMLNGEVIRIDGGLRMKP